MKYRSICGAAALLFCIGADYVIAAEAQGTKAPGTKAQGTKAVPGKVGTEPRSTAILPPVSVTATRNPITVFEYPGMVSVIDRSQIELYQPSSPDDFLKWVPNVEFTGGPRRTGELPSIRGFSGPDLVVLIDGARQNFASAHDGRFSLDPSLVRQAEVVRGPASALYGSGGAGGVFEFRTVRARDLLAPGKQTGISAATGFRHGNREKFGTLTGYGVTGNGMDLVGSITKRNSGSIELGNGTELDRTDDDIISGLAKIGFSVRQHHQIEASFQRFENDAVEPNNAQGVGGLDQVDKEIRSDTSRLTYGFHDPDNALIDFDAIVYFTASQADELRLDARGEGPVGELLRRDVDTTGARLDNRSQFSFTENMGVTLTYGGEAYRDEQKGAAGAGLRDGVPNAKTEFTALFTQAEFRWRKPLGFVPGNLLLIPGMRYDQFDSSSSLAAGSSDEELSPRIGLSYLPWDWSLLFVNYASAFRAPSINELYITGVHFRIPVGPGVINRFVPNPQLKPQNTETFEIGAGVEFDGLFTPDGTIRAKGSYFRTEGKDFIDLAVVQPALFRACNPFIRGNCDGRTTASNVRDARLNGRELEVSYENSRVRFALGYSSVNGEDTITGRKLGVLTPDQITLDTTIPVPPLQSLVGWRLLAANQFDKVNSPADIRDGYAVHDIFFAWRPRHHRLAGLQADLGIDNIFDKSYTRVFTSANEAGRSYNASLRYALQW